jgi:hypothetical protein
VIDGPVSGIAFASASTARSMTENDTSAQHHQPSTTKMPHRLPETDRVQLARDILEVTEAHLQECCAQLSMREYIEARQKWNEAAAD